jgi:CubicO group peptidase (beta-lactamase class C family)
MVLHNGNLLYENYWNGNTATSQHIAFSVTKSFVSALIGIAHQDGLIDSIEDPITKYLPDFNGTGYEGVRIKDILQMSSGVKWNEDYADPNSDINRFGRTIAKGSSFRDFAKTLEREKEPGTFHHYVSIDTQILGFLLAEVTGMPLKDYLYEKIWNKIGMEDEAYFIVDNDGVEMALGGLNATLRDFAKFGLLYANKGQWNGENIVPASWVDASHQTDAPHLIPGEHGLSSSPWGYGLQWWVPGFPDTDYTASGVYNQYIYIDPLKNVVIAKNSSNHRFTSEKEYSKAAHVAMFRAIAKSIN